jgi:hypothetical protein
MVVVVQLLSGKVPTDKTAGNLANTGHVTAFPLFNKNQANYQEAWRIFTL